jgi:hypothetical protein
VNPSQESAQPQNAGGAPVDPTADPVVYGAAASPDAGEAASHRAGGTDEARFADPAAQNPGFGRSLGAGADSDSRADSGAQPGAAGELGNGGGYGLAHPSGPQGYGAVAGRTVRRPWRRTVAVAVSVAVVVVILGIPLGLLWRWLAPSVPVIDAGPGGIVVNDPSPEQFIAADGWFTLLGLGFGLLVAILAWLVLKKDRGPFLLLGVVVGTLGAGYLTAPWIGEMIGRGAYREWRETATQGATYLAPPELHSVGPSLVPAFIAAVALTLLAGWSNDPDLDKPGAKPGYGANAEPGGPDAANAQPGYGPYEANAQPGYGPYEANAQPGYGPYEANAQPGYGPQGANGSNAAPGYGANEPR